MTHHKVKKLVSYRRLAVQYLDFKAFKRLTLINAVDFLLKLIEEPRHRISKSLNIVDFETLAFEDLNLR